MMVTTRRSTRPLSSFDCQRNEVLRTCLSGLLLLVGSLATFVPVGFAHGDEVVLWGAIRDFRASHPDFEDRIGADPGIVEDQLGDDGKPVYAGRRDNPTTSGAEWFDQWFRDVDGVNMSAPLGIALQPSGDRHRGRPVFEYDGRDFFPIDDQLFGNEGLPHNFHFTYELHASFRYEGGEMLEFTGDDDLWLFVNGHLVIDLGGVHSAAGATVVLDEVAERAGLELGGTYPFDLFFAERHTNASDFVIQTTLALESGDGGDGEVPGDDPGDGDPGDGEVPGDDPGDGDPGDGEVPGDDPGDGDPGDGEVPGDDPGDGDPGDDPGDGDPGDGDPGDGDPGDDPGDGDPGDGELPGDEPVDGDPGDGELPGGEVPGDGSPGDGAGPGGELGGDTAGHLPWDDLSLQGGACAHVSRPGGGGSAGLLAGAFFVLLLGVQRRRRWGRLAGGVLSAALLAAAVLGALLSSAPAARAQTGVPAQAFEASPFPEDLLTLGTGVDGEESLRWSAGVIFGYQNDPLVLRSSVTGQEVRTVVGDQVTADLLLSYRLHEILSLGLAMPLVLFQQGDGLPGNQSPAAAGPGDLRLAPRFRLFRSPSRLFTVSFTPQLSLPTGGQVDPYLGRSGITLLPRLETSFAVGRRGGLTFDLGYLVAANEQIMDLEQADELRFRLGAWLDVLPGRVALLAELAGAAEAAAPFASARQSPLELLAGGRVELPAGLQLRAGLGAGLTPGYSTPDYRVLTGIIWQGRRDPDEPPPSMLPGWNAGALADQREADGDGTRNVDEVEPTPVAAVQPEPEPDDEPAKVEGDRLVLDNILFHYNSTRIKAGSHRALDKVVRFLRSNPQVERLAVEGHTDTRGGNRLNLRLSRGRADAVRSYLIAQGIEPQRLVVRAFGERQPLVLPERVEAHYQANRRVEFVILDGKRAER